MRADYAFLSTWTVPAAPAAVAAVLTDLAAYPSWWPQVCAVARIDDDTARVLCRSVLPYTLDLVLHAESRELPELAVAVAGDLDGWIRWRLAPDPDDPAGTRLELRQQVSVAGTLAAASLVARPLLRWNHARMLAGGETGLRSRLG